MSKIIPYYAVIFTSHLKLSSEEYQKSDDLLQEKLQNTNGYLGMESYRDVNNKGVTISYWKDLDSLKNWKADPDHQSAQEKGKTEWFSSYKVRIGKIESEYDFNWNE